jgi:four helix bundle protein
MAGQSYRDLIAWQKAMNLAEEVWTVSEGWPRAQLFGLTDQVRRASVSIPSNLAEGQGRNGRAEFRRFLDIAHGSLCELETQLMLGCRFRFLDDPTLDRLLTQAAEVGRLVHGLLRSLSHPTNPGQSRLFPRPLAPGYWLLASDHC